MENKKVVSSLAFKMTEQLAAKLIGLVISIILARLLSPDDFGQLAILTVFINLSLNLIQTGFGNALVQTKELGKSDYSTAFYINIAISFVMVVVLFFLAPLIGKIYDSDGLIAPLRFYSLSLLFGAFNSIQTAKLQREMRFKASLFARLVATILSGATGIALAYLGYGLWALVVYNFSYIVLSSITMFCVCRWLPKFEFSKERAKVLWGFGWKMLVSSFLCSIYYDLRSLIIGKKYSTDDLGYYSRGDQFPFIISHTVETGIQSVMFPVLSKIQDQTEKLRETLKKTVSMGCLFVFPVMMGLLVVAKPLTIILLTEKWLPSVPYMQLLCLAYASFAFSSANLTAIKSVGRSDVYMKLEIIRRVIMVAILLVTVFAFNSVMAIVIGYVISLWLDVIIISIPVKKLLGLGAISQFKLIWKILVATIVMGVATYFVGKLDLSMFSLLIAQILTGVVVYFIACLILRDNSFMVIFNAIKKFLSKNKKQEDRIEELKLKPIQKDGILEKCDFIKVLMMLTIIAYHCICFWSSKTWFNQPPAQPSSVLAGLVTWLNTFHIYTFVFVSGYLFYYLRVELGKYDKFGAFVKNKALRLLVPYLLVSILWAIPFQLIYFDPSITDILLNFGLAISPNQLWFLVMLFVLFCIFYPLTWLLDRSNSFIGLLIALVMYGASIVLARIVPNVFNFESALKFFIFFYLGFAVRKNKNNFACKIPWFVYLILQVGVFALNYFVISGSELMVLKVLNLITTPLCSILGVFMVVVFVKSINVEKIQQTKVFKLFSKHNFVMYLFHQQLIYISLSFLNGVVDNWIIILANLIVSILGSLLISVLIDKIPKIRTLFGYKDNKKSKKEN